MAIEALEIRMAKLEGGYEQINERLGTIEHRITSELASLRSEMASLRSEMAARADVASLQSEMGSIRSEMATRSDLAELRRQMNAQFFWVLTFVLGSILIPILRDFAR